MNQENNKKYCILFAGPIGCSKTPIANYLSCQFGLPILSNDSIRTEVAEDLGGYNQEEFEKRRDRRLEEMFKKDESFICDASIDRKWPEIKKYIDQYHFNCFIVSINLTKNFLIKLYNIKGYDESLKSIDRFIDDHEKFFTNNEKEIDVTIDDENFKDRLRTIENKFEDWLGSNKT
jgi:hypothetical protein